MASLPVLSGIDVVKVFHRFGWSVARQNSSHICYDERGRDCVTVNSRSQGSRAGNSAQPHSLGKPNS